MSVMPNPQFNFDSLTLCPTSKGTFPPIGIKVLLVGSAVANDAKASSNRRSETKTSREFGFDRVKDGVVEFDCLYLLLLLTVVIVVSCLFVAFSMTKKDTWRQKSGWRGRRVLVLIDRNREAVSIQIQMVWRKGKRNDGYLFVAAGKFLSLGQHSRS